MPNYRALKISRKHYKMYQAVLYLVVPYSQNYAARIQGLYHECSDCFEYPQKNPYLDQGTQKITCQIFLPQKIPEKNPSLIPVT